MYTEEFEEKKSVIKTLIIKTLIILGVILVCFLIVSGVTRENLVNKEKVTITPYTSSVYKDNISHIKDVVLNYYKKADYEKITAKGLTITVEELVKKQLLVPVLDQNDKVCNAKESYANITLVSPDLYLLKIKLKCASVDDYVTTSLIHANYCSGYVCDKDAISIKNKTSKAVKEVKFSNTSVYNTKIKEKVKDKEFVINPVENIEYEYKKTTKAKFSKWTSYTPFRKTSCNIVEENCNDLDPNCLRKTVKYTQNEEIGSYKKEYNAPHNEIKQSGLIDFKGCSSYNYVSIDNVIYAISNIYTVINNISTGTKSTQGSWKYEGEKTFTGTVSDTATTRYLYIKTDFSACGKTCDEASLKYVYDVYTYTGTLTPATDNKEYTCNGSFKKSTPVYTTKNTNHTSKRSEPVYGDVCYYSMKTREVLNKGKSESLYSTYNNEDLLTKKYYYTGKYQVAKKK